jgi:hypothetical protein
VELFDPVMNGDLALDQESLKIQLADLSPSGLLAPA